jgi:hypothetical protein
MEAMKSLVAFILSSVVGCLACAPARAEVQGAELRLQGGGPYYTLQLPMALRSRAAAADLHDLHVLNARGEPLPFAWVDVVPVSTQEHEQAVPIFKVPGPASGAKPTAPRSWLLDARAVEGCMTTLELTLPESTRGVFSPVVETSADMQHWRVVQASAQVISLEHQGQRLTSTVIDLAGTPGSYVRLTALPRSLLPEPGVALPTQQARTARDAVRERRATPLQPRRGAVVAATLPFSPTPSTSVTKSWEPDSL